MARTWPAQPAGGTGELCCCGQTGYVTMAPTLDQLRAMTDDQLTRVYDQVAQHTGVGLNFYLEELHRRASDRSADAALELARAAVDEARASRRLAKANMVVAVVAVVVSIAAILAKAVVTAV